MGKLAVKRRGFTQAMGTVVALVVLVLGITAGVLYQDSASIVGRTGAGITTTVETTVNSVGSTITSTLLSTLTATSTLTQGVQTVTSTTTSQATSTSFVPTTVLSTTTSTVSAGAISTVSTVTTSTVTSVQTSLTTLTSTSATTLTSTVTTTPSPPATVAVYGSVTSKAGTLNGIVFNGVSNGAVAGSLNGGSYTVSLPNPDTYTVVIDYTQGSAKSCTAGTLVLDESGTAVSVSADWSC